MALHDVVNSNAFALIRVQNKEGRFEWFNPADMVKAYEHPDGGVHICLRDNGYGIRVSTDEWLKLFRQLEGMA